MAAHKIFVNLPVNDLKKTMAFFSALGFEFNPQFCDENAACMIISEEAYAMLLVRSYFQTFTDKQICDSSTHTEVGLALSCESREAVDAMVEKVVAAGGKAAKSQDHGFMYWRSFYDLDEHHWEVLWMDPAFLAQQGVEG